MHPLHGVPDALELPMPEPLSAANAKDGRPLMAVFGEYVVQCLYSRQWNLREAALNKVKYELPVLCGNGSDSQAMRDVTGMTCAVLQRAIKDKIAQVSLRRRRRSRR